MMDRWSIHRTCCGGTNASGCLEVNHACSAINYRIQVVVRKLRGFLLLFEAMGLKRERKQF